MSRHVLFGLVLFNAFFSFVLFIEDVTHSGFCLRSTLLYCLYISRV